VIPPKSKPKPAADVPAAIVAIVDRRDGGSDRFDGRGIGAGRNLHHRQLRSQGPLHTPSNLVTMRGSGTTGTHGHMHHNRAYAQRYGFIIPSYIEDTTTVPIRVANRWGLKGWATFDDDGQEHPLAPGDVVTIMRDLGLWAPLENWL